MIAFLRFELVRALRNVRFLVMLIAFPVLIYLIYAKQHGMSQGLTVATLLLVSMAVYSGMGSAMFVADQRPRLVRRETRAGHPDDHPGAGGAHGAGSDPR